MLNPLLELIGVHLKDISHITYTGGCKSLLIDVNVTVVGTSIGRVDVQVYWILTISNARYHKAGVAYLWSG